MQHGRRTVLTLSAAGCLIVGGALGSGLLSAGAATNGSPGTAPAASGGTPHGSNEAKAHEAGESAAREAAENNGTATYGPRHGDGTFHPNEDPAHEAGESAQREAEEGAGTAAPPSAPSTGSDTAGTGST